MSRGLVHFFDVARFVSSSGTGDGGTVYFYYAGTTTLAPIYSDAALTVAMTNPVSVAVGQIVPKIYLDASIRYRRRIIFLSDGAIQDEDPLPGQEDTDLISVKDYGAVGDGITSDTAADIAARASLKAKGGGTLLYPSAVGYKIGTQVRTPGILIEDDDFPAWATEEPPSALRVYTRNNGGAGKSGIYSFIVNGTGNMTPFTTLGVGDSVAMSAICYSGNDAPNPVAVLNVISRYAGLPPGINWGVEIDMNNETSASYSQGDPRGGQALVLNTGSTYSPDTAIVIQRTIGEGTGPGWKQGIWIKGARDSAITVTAMTSAIAPGMSPAATGSIAAFVVNVGGEGFNSFTINERGRMDWGGGSSAQDVYLARGGVGALVCSGVLGANQYFVGADSVIGARRTGWTAPTGTLSRTTFDQATVTLPQLAQRVAALITDLHGQAGGHGLIGN